MNLNCDKEYFDYDYNRFQKITDFSKMDNGIIELVKKFKEMPFLDKVLPRWSCSSHDDIKQSEFYIIFLTQNEGQELLYNMFLELNDRITQTTGFPNMVRLEVIHLYGLEDKPAQPNISIRCLAYGMENYIEMYRTIWMELLEDMKREYNGT